MEESPSGSLMPRLEGGDPRAARELFDRYTERLISLARQRLPAALSPRLDPEDVVQSVYRSFFAAVRDGRYSFQHGIDLWRLLTTITLNKIRASGSWTGYVVRGDRLPNPVLASRPTPETTPRIDRKRSLGRK